MIRILIADDHTLVREGLSRLLNELPNMQIIGGAATGEEAVQYVRELQPILY